MVLNRNLLQTLAEYTLQRFYNSNRNCSGCTLLMMSPQKGLEKNYILKLKTLKHLSHIHAHSATLLILLLVAPWNVLVFFFINLSFVASLNAVDRVLDLIRSSGQIISSTAKCIILLPVWKEKRSEGPVFPA